MAASAIRRSVLSGSLALFSKFVLRRDLACGPHFSYQILIYTRGMPKRLALAEHLPVADLQQRYRQATDPVARSQWQILWLLAQRLPTEEVARVTGYSL